MSTSRIIGNSLAILIGLTMLIVTQTHYTSLTPGMAKDTHRIAENFQTTYNINASPVHVSRADHFHYRAAMRTTLY